jgi:hypothetical protein
MQYQGRTHIQNAFTRHNEIRRPTGLAFKNAQVAFVVSCCHERLPWINQQRLQPFVNRTIDRPGLVRVIPIQPPHRAQNITADSETSARRKIRKPRHSRPVIGAHHDRRQVTTQSPPRRANPKSKTHLSCSWKLGAFAPLRDTIV